MDNSLNDDHRFVWQKVLLEALVELNRDKLKDKVAEAEGAISLRIQALGPSDQEERQALHDASHILLTLKRETLQSAV